MSQRFIVLTVVGLLAATIGVGADDPQKPESQSDAKASSATDVKTVAKRLEPVFEKLDPAVAVKFDDRVSSFEVSYRTQKFKIHHINKRGVISEEAYDEIGPSHQGFILRVFIQPSGEANQFVTPQTIREPYWTTELNITPLGNSNKQLYWSISYGSRPEDKLLDAIRVSIKKLGCCGSFTTPSPVDI